MHGTSSPNFETWPKKMLSSERIRLLMSDVISCAIAESVECLECVHPNCRYL